MGELTAVFEHTGHRWIAYIEEIPGVNTQGETLEEARENLQEATRLVLDANRAIAQRQNAGKEVLREAFALSSR